MWPSICWNCVMNICICSFCWFLDDSFSFCMAMRSALISWMAAAALVSPLLPVTELAILWHAFKFSAKSLASLVWKS